MVICVERQGRKRTDAQPGRVRLREVRWQVLCDDVRAPVAVEKAAGRPWCCVEATYEILLQFFWPSSVVIVVAR